MGIYRTRRIDGRNHAQFKGSNIHERLRHPNTSILARLSDIEKTLLEHDTALYDVYQKLVPLLLPEEPEQQKKRIGFNS